MIPNRLIEATVVAAMIAVGSGHLPQILNAVRVAQLNLIQESKASTWPKALLLKLRSRSSSMRSELKSAKEDFMKVIEIKRSVELG